MDDNANIMDANTFEFLAQHCPISSSVYLEMDPPDGELSSAPPPEHHDTIPIQSETGNSDADLILVVKHFPHGRPGALVTGTPQGTTIYESTQDTLGESVWAPFQSQCDWEIALWAKKRRPSSLAMADLLVIPGV